MPSNLNLFRDELNDYARLQVDGEEQTFTEHEAPRTATDQAEVFAQAHDRPAAQLTVFDVVPQYSWCRPAPAIQKNKAPYKGHPYFQWHTQEPAIAISASADGHGPGSNIDLRAQGDRHHQPVYYYQTSQAHAKASVTAPEHQPPAYPQGYPTVIAGHHLQEQIYERSDTSEQPQDTFLDAPVLRPSDLLPPGPEPQLAPDLFLPTSSLELHLEPHRDTHVRIAYLLDGPRIHYPSLTHPLELDNPFPGGPRIHRPSLTYVQEEEHKYDQNGAEECQRQPAKRSATSTLNDDRDARPTKKSRFIPLRKWSSSRLRHLLRKERPRNLPELIKYADFDVVRDVPISELVKEWTEVTVGNISGNEGDDEHERTKREIQGKWTVNVSIGSRAYVADIPVAAEGSSDSRIPFHLRVQDQTTGKMLWDMSWTWYGD